MPGDPTENLFTAIDERRDDLVKLTRALIRFPTVNPPGEAYRPCAEFIGDRLRTRGFTVDYVHAAGTPGDNERYPRINVIARRASAAPGPCVHFNSHIDVAEGGPSLRSPPW
jgi:succinyl-diaminopimelate desuccinylase